MNILVNVVGQQMHASSSRINELVSGSQKFVKFKFNLSPEWNGLRIFAQFRQGPNSYNEYLDKDGCVYLPSEIIEGSCTLMLYGTLDTTIGTTNYLTLKISKNHLVQDSESTEISQSLYNQLVAHVDKLELRFNDLSNNESIQEQIVAAVEKEMDAYLNSGAIGFITYIDHSEGVSTTLKDLDAGQYILNGFFPYQDLESDDGITLHNKTVFVDRYPSTDTTVVQFFTATRLDSITISSTNIKQTNTSFDSLERTTRLVNQIDKDSDHEHYPTAKAVFDALGMAGGGDCAVQTITGTKDNPVYLRGLESGIYQLVGTFYYAEGISGSLIMNEPRFVIVRKTDSFSAVRIFHATGADITYRIEDTSYTSYDMPHLKMLTTDDLVAAIDSTADDEHIPTAKAVKDYVGQNGGGSATTPDHSMYFDIDVDGIVSLKAEYKADGALNSELPEVLVIPDVINDIAVTGLTKSMFSKNHRIRSLTIPSTITTIPRAFLSNAINLTEITGTENIEMIEQAAFQKCGIKKAIFPKLKTLVDAGHFNLAANLSIVDIGNEITSIPASAFAYCDRLSLVKGGSNVTSIGANAFFDTASLKNLPIVANVQSIGGQAFLRSRVTYDWWALENKLGSDAFGTDATPAQYNAADWWSKCTTVPCKNTLGSLFHQKNPEWASLQIANSDDTYGDGGCLEVSASHIYSAFGGKNIDGEDLKSPCEFIDVIRNTDESLLEPYVNPTSGKKSYTFGEGYKWFDALGFDAELLAGGYSAENLPNVYDALANGALVLTWINPGHAGVIFGISENSEVLVLDSDSMNYVFNDFTPRIYQQPIWSLAKAGQDVMIVKRKEE